MTIQRFWAVLAFVSLTALAGGPVLAQAGKTESVDDVSADNDILGQLNGYDLTVEQLTKMVPILKELDTQRQALEAHKHSDEALAPLRALRQAHLKGRPSPDLENAAQTVWNKVDELESALEDAVHQALEQTTKLLTDDQLAIATQADDVAAEEADMALNDLETARDFGDADFAKWRDQEARDLAKRLVPEDAPQAAQLEKSVKVFLDKARKLSANAYAAQADQLYEELHALIAAAHPERTRATAEEQATEELQYILESERTLPLIEAMLQARR